MYLVSLIKILFKPVCNNLWKYRFFFHFFFSAISESIDFTFIDLKIAFHVSLFFEICSDEICGLFKI